ncbi:MAG: hypothetical protein J6X55_10305 [Victivallales bacterium]|nr:hypothetical protein [Victivallales bacterium]
MKETSGRPRNLCSALSIIGAVLFIVGLIVCRTGNCSVMLVGCASSVVVILLGLVGAGRCAFERRQQQEERSAAEFRKEHGRNELFEDADEAVRLATRANMQYTRYFIPIFTVVLGLALFIFCLLVWRSWEATETFPVAGNPMPLALLSVLSWIATLILGSYFIGASREPGCRWLRPASAWLFFNGFLFLLASIALFLEYFKKMVLTADITLARIGMVVLAILAIELVLAFVIEFYRPRMPGEAERPLPESRLLALVTEPGGLARNVASSLDYQFGFQVSEAWFFRFLERTVVPLVVVLVLAFWLQTCLVVINTGEQGLFEKFGRVESTEPSGAGIYFKLPWPFTRIERFNVEKIQEVVLGEDHEHEHEEEEEEEEEDDHGHSHGPKKPKHQEHDERVILWSVAHAEKELNYIVASRHAEKLNNAGLDNNENSKLNHKKIPPSALLVAHVPVSFRVKNIYDFKYRQSDAMGLLKNLGTRVWIHFLANVDFQDLLGEGRLKASEILKKRIQESADEMQLGVEIITVSVASIHPPVEVGSEYDKQMSAHEEVNRQLQQSRVEADRIVSEARSEQNAILAAAMMDNFKRDKSYVQAEAELFASQLTRYNACPDIFKIDSELRVVEEASQHLRKYIVGTGLDVELYDLNLERKNEGTSLLDLGVEAP